MIKFYSNANMILRNVLLMLNAIYSRCIVLICVVHLFGMIIVKQQFIKIRLLTIIV